MGKINTNLPKYRRKVKGDSDCSAVVALDKSSASAHQDSDRANREWSQDQLALVRVPSPPRFDDVEVAAEAVNPSQVVPAATGASSGSKKRSATTDEAGQISKKRRGDEERESEKGKGKEKEKEKVREKEKDRSKEKGGRGASGKMPPPRLHDSGKETGGVVRRSPAGKGKGVPVRRPGPFDVAVDYSGDNMFINDFDACTELYSQIRFGPSPPMEVDEPGVAEDYRRLARTSYRAQAYANRVVDYYQRTLAECRAEIERRDVAASQADRSVSEKLKQARSEAAQDLQVAEARHTREKESMTSEIEKLKVANLALEAQLAKEREEKEEEKRLLSEMTERYTRETARLRESRAHCVVNERKRVLSVVTARYEDVLEKVRNYRLDQDRARDELILLAKIEAQLECCQSLREDYNYEAPRDYLDDLERDRQAKVAEIESMELADLEDADLLVPPFTEEALAGESGSNAGMVTPSVAASLRPSS